MAFDEAEFQQQRNLWYFGGPPPPAPNWETFIFHSHCGPDGLPVCDLYSPPFHIPYPPHLISDQPRAALSATPPPPPPPDTPPQSQPPNPTQLHQQVVQDWAENVPQPQLHPASRPPQAVRTPNPALPYNQAAGVGPQGPPPPAITVNKATIIFRVSIPRNGVLREVEFPSDIEPNNLWLRICAEADLPTSRAKTAAPHALDSTEDLRQAIISIVSLVRRARTQTPVLTVLNLAPPPPVVPVARKGGATPCPATLAGGPSDAILPTQQLQHLRDLKLKYACAKHSGTHRWCLVKDDGDDVGQHLALTIQFLILWAQQITDGKTTLDKSPNAKEFDLKKRARNNAEKQASSSTPTMPSIIIQNHLPAALGDATNLPSKKRKHVVSDSDSSSGSDSESTNISTLLATLNAKYPALNFLQYKDVLQKNNIAYVNIAAKIEEKFLKGEVGMPLGAIGVFLKGCRRAVKADKARRATKHVARGSDSD